MSGQQMHLSIYDDRLNSDDYRNGYDAGYGDGYGDYPWEEVLNNKEFDDTTTLWREGYMQGWIDGKESA